MDLITFPRYLSCINFITINFVLCLNSINLKSLLPFLLNVEGKKNHGKSYLGILFRYTHTHTHTACLDRMLLL